MVHLGFERVLPDQILLAEALGQGHDLAVVLHGARIAQAEDPGIIGRQLERQPVSGGVPVPGRKTEKLDAGDVGHANIADRHVDISLAQPLQCLFAVGGDRDGVARVTRGIGQYLPDRRFVVDD